MIDKDKHENGDTKFYTLTKYCKDNYEREVVYDGSTLNCSFDSNMMVLARFGAYLRDPVPVKGRGAPKKKKTDTKTIRRCGRCDSTTHNARSCSRAKKAPVGKNVKLDSVSLTDSVSQTEKNKKR
ncbi:hypothetical protein P8452_51498 [Trifolium repens]|nr:hypothetical protein P8452_51498 [Trifolium repens]